MQLTSIVEAVRALQEGKSVYAHREGKYPKLTISESDKLLLDGVEVRASEMLLIFETEEDPSLMLMHVLHSLMRGSEELYETKGKERATAYISGEDGPTRLITIAVPKGSSHALTAQWVRV